MQENITKTAVEHMNKLKSGVYKENTGWLDLERVDLIDIKQTAECVLRNSEVLVVVGTGGSFLGSKAIIEALSNPFKKAIEVMYLGNDLSSLNLNQTGILDISLPQQLQVSTFYNNFGNFTTIILCLINILISAFINYKMK